MANTKYCCKKPIIPVITSIGCFVLMIFILLRNTQLPSRSISSNLTISDLSSNESMFHDPIHELSSNTSGLPISELCTDISSTIFDFLCAEQLIRRYIISYDRLHHKTKQAMMESIKRRMYSNALSFNQIMKLNLFWTNKTLSLDDDTKYLQQYFIQETPQKLTEIIYNHTTMDLHYLQGENYVVLLFDDYRYLKRIFTKLSELNVNITGIVSLKSICGDQIELKNIDRLELNMELDLFSDLEECKTLKRLDFPYVQSISNIEPLRKVKSLEYLFLNDNDITNIDALSELKALTHLILDGKHISNIDALRGLKRLKALHLNDKQISNIDALRDLKRLEDLELSGNKISNIDALRELFSLKFLELQNNKISNIDALRELTGLECLRLQNNNISNIDALRELKGLESLSLGNNSISNVNALYDLNELEILRLYPNPIPQRTRDQLQFHGLHYKIPDFENMS